MHNALLVPIHLDALYLESDRTVLEPMADFTHLPYFDGKRDVNPDNANISEKILSQPFQDRGFQLRRGVHLHWALPDGLTRWVGDDPEIAKNSMKKGSFPVVPNRWLVTRSDTDTDTDTGGGKKQWIVESDYLYPPGQGAQSSGISYPCSSEKDPQPFRFMGRAMPLADWQPRSKNNDYLDKLTAVGYGEPTFAAFYPNCHSVFGFYDVAPNLNGMQYDLIGWYSNPNQDCLLSEAFNQAVSDSDKAEYKYQALKEYYGWLPDKPDSAFPEQTICYASLTFGGKPPNALQPENKAVIALGNTSTEALSAYLAYRISKETSASSNLSTAELQKVCTQLEDQLESLHLSDRLEGRKLDLGLKFKEARHEKEFAAVTGGTIWTIRPDSGATNQGDAQGTERQVTLPKDLAHLLNQLNIQQQAFDRDGDEIESMRKQLFADWYKYMICAYPPSDRLEEYPNLDQARFFIEKNSLIPLQRRIVRNKALWKQCQEAVKDLRRRVEEVNLKSIESKQNLPYILKQIPAPRYWLPNEPVVLIVDPTDKANKTIRQTDRHGRDGRLHEDSLLECQLLSLDTKDTMIEKNFDKILNKIETLKPTNTQERIGFSTWTEQPWHPFLLEWEVEVYPLKGKYLRGKDKDIDSNTPHPLTRNYGSDCIKDNYQLAENAVDLKVIPGQETLAKEQNVYFGRSILTPHAQIQLQEQVNDFLEKELLSDYYTDQKIATAERTNDYFAQNKGKIIGWYKNKPKDKDKQMDIIEQILKVDETLGANFCVLAQSLGGFNEALLMQKQTLQLPIEDPLGFADYQPFTEAVKQAIAGCNRVAPQPRNDFNPIRTGILKIRKLRLVDTFGQVQPLTFEQDEVITTDVMTVPENLYLVVLPPRFVQPARLNFRWLSSDQDFVPDSTAANTNGHGTAIDEVEMNDHPATSPICGWLLPNNLDNSLMVYDDQGQALGSITQDCQWFSAPGRRAIAVGEIAQRNVYLHRLIAHLLGQGEEFMASFLTVVENAMDNIDPENAAQHDAIALLMGRPIAVVRARMDLELQGLPAFDQEWNIFRQAVECEANGKVSTLLRSKDERTGVETILRETENFTQVDFPIRVGEYRQLNDGLVGFWKESKLGGFDNPADFYINDSIKASVLIENPNLDQNNPNQNEIKELLINKDRPVDKQSFLTKFANGAEIWQELINQKVIKERSYDKICFYADKPDLYQSIASDPLMLTMLVDPRGSVHATSGILPTKSIHIPVDQFTEALRNIEVAFLTTPILTNRGSINLPLPTEPGYVWSWIEKENGDWHPARDVETVNPQATFTAQQEIREGWLKLKPDGG